jgi:hypothetical protein
LRRSLDGCGYDGGFGFRVTNRENPYLGSAIGYSWCVVGPEARQPAKRICQP